MTIMAGGKHRKIIMDISQEACKELDFPKSGEAEVEVEKQQ
jgi:rare lipoprotein A (peptidoglycan hydrolase)